MKYYRSTKSPAPDFNPEIWADVGASIMRALLDYDSLNPESRLVRNADQTPLKQLEAVRAKLKQKIIYKKHLEAIKEQEEAE